jgi:hypothetical protein
MDNSKQEDLDTLYVISSLKKALLSLLRSIRWLLAFSIDKAKALSLFILFFTGLSIGLYLLNPVYYSSRMTLSHIRVDNDYCYELIDNLNSIIDHAKGNTELGKILGLSEPLAKNIKRIKYDVLNDNLAKRYSDSSTVLLPFSIVVDVYDNSVLDSLQKGFLNYLESNDYAIRRKTIDEEALLKTEKKLKEEILENDSLKLLVNKSIVPRATGTGIILGEPIDPVSVYKRGLELYEREISLNKKKLLNNSFELIVGFSKKTKPANVGLLFYVMAGFLFGYFTGLLVLLNKRFKPLVKKDF